MDKNGKVTIPVDKLDTPVEALLITAVKVPKDTPPLDVKVKECVEGEYNICD